MSKWAMIICISLCKTTIIAQVNAIIDTSDCSKPIAIGKIKGKAVLGLDTPLENIRVYARELRIGINKPTKTDKTGNFVIDSLPTGRYQLSLYSEGFKPLDLFNIIVGVDSTSEVLARMILYTKEEWKKLLKLHGGPPPMIKPSDTDSRTRWKADEIRRMPGS